jgi:hypothetical protein
MSAAIAGAARVVAAIAARNNIFIAPLRFPKGGM